MENIIIKPVGLQDVEQLQTIGRNTFAQTFSEHNSAEDMEAYLNTSYAIEKLIAEISSTPTNPGFISTISLPRKEMDH